MRVKFLLALSKRQQARISELEAQTQLLRTVVNNLQQGQSAINTVLLTKADAEDLTKITNQLINTLSVLEQTHALVTEDTK